MAEGNISQIKSQSTAMLIDDLLEETSLSESFVELAFDSLLEDGIVKDIPAFSTLLAMLKMPKSWNDFQLRRNIIRFFKPLTNISEIERQTFLSKLENQSKFRVRIGENLLLHLSQVDDIRKPEIIGRIFAYLIKGKIDFSHYEELVTALKKVNVNYFKELILFYSYCQQEKKLVGASEELVKKEKISRNAMQNLIQANLVDSSCMPDIVIASDVPECIQIPLKGESFGQLRRFNPIAANGIVIVEIIEDRHNIFS